MTDVVARTVQEFCRAYGIGKTTAYELIATGKLEARKAGTRTLIVEESAKQWLEGLSTAETKKKTPQPYKMTNTPEYYSWSGMLQRCENINSPSYPYYGGRGIWVCERWHKFEYFYADMGPKPSPSHSLDRWPNNDGNYEPSNCRWATRSEQRQNRRPNLKGPPVHKSVHNRDSQIEGKAVNASEPQRKRQYHKSRIPKGKMVNVFP